MCRLVLVPEPPLGGLGSSLCFFLLLCSSLAFHLFIDLLIFLVSLAVSLLNPLFVFLVACGLTGLLLEAGSSPWVVWSPLERPREAVPWLTRHTTEGLWE